MWAQEGECGVHGCDGCQYGGAGEPVTEEVQVRAYHVKPPSAAEEIGQALANIPGEIAYWWSSGHYRSPWLRKWEDGNCADPGARPLFYADDTETLNSFSDYRLWRALGFVTDGLILVLVLAIVLTVALALI
jgi:hypothetical protein